MQAEFVISTISFIAWCIVFIILPLYALTDYLTTKLSKAKHYKHGAPKPNYTIPIPHAYTPAPPKNGSCVQRPKQTIRIVIEERQSK